MRLMLPRCAYTTAAATMVDMTSTGTEPGVNTHENSGNAMAAQMEPAEMRLVASATTRKTASMHSTVRGNATKMEPNPVEMPLPPLKPSHVPEDGSHDARDEQQVDLPLRVDARDEGEHEAHDAERERSLARIADKRDGRRLDAEQARHVSHADGPRPPVARVLPVADLRDDDAEGDAAQQKRLDDGEDEREGK